MPKIRVGDKGTTYIPDDLRANGYIGNLEAILGVCALIIPKPGATNKDIAKSLENTAREFIHKAELAGEIYAG